jgi:hypothetical protein
MRNTKFVFSKELQFSRANASVICPRDQRSNLGIVKMQFEAADKTKHMTFETICLQCGAQLKRIGGYKLKTLVFAPV